MASVLSHRILKNCIEISKLGQNMSRQNSKFTQIEPLRIQTWWQEKPLIIYRYALLLPYLQYSVLSKQLNFVMRAKYEYRIELLLYFVIIFTKFAFDSSPGCNMNYKTHMFCNWSLSQAEFMSLFSHLLQTFKEGQKVRRKMSQCWLTSHFEL